MKVIFRGKHFTNLLNLHVFMCFPSANLVPDQYPLVYMYMKVYRDSKCEFGWVLVHRYCWKSPYDQYRMFRNYCFAKNTNIFACPRVRHRTLFTYDCCACARHKWREKRQTTFEKTPNCNNGVVSRELYWAARWK